MGQQANRLAVSVGLLVLAELAQVPRRCRKVEPVGCHGSICNDQSGGILGYLELCLALPVGVQTMGSLSAHSTVVYFLATEQSRRHSLVPVRGGRNMGAFPGGLASILENRASGKEYF